MKIKDRILIISDIETFPSKEELMEVNDLFDSIIIQYSLSGTIHYCNKKLKFHREDGPAIIIPGGIKYYYINGKFIRIIIRNSKKMEFFNET